MTRSLKLATVLEPLRRKAERIVERLSAAHRLAIVGLSALAYGASLPSLFRAVGHPAEVLGVLVAALAGWLLGSAYGVASAIAIQCLVVAQLPGESGDAPLAALSFAFVGWLVGQLQASASRLHRQSQVMERALQLIQEREALMARAQALSHTGSWEWNAGENEVWWSVEMHRIHGTTPIDFQPTLSGAMSFIHPEDRSRIEETLAGALRTGESVDLQYRVVRRDGSLGILRCQTDVTRDHDGAVARILATAQDITDRVNLEARLVMSDRLASLGTLAGGVAHEINNPLSYVAFNLQFLSEELPGIAADSNSPLAKELIEAMVDAREGADRIRRIVQDLKSFSRADDEAPGPIDVRKVIDLAVKMSATEVRPRAGLVLDLQPTPPVIANDSRLGQVILNLLVNAAQAIPEGHPAENEIKVSTRTAEGGRVLIEVSDTGAGIPTEIGNRVFDPFFTTKPVGVGTGLGLSICHGIIQAFGGEITLTSEVGKGTTFTVALRGAEAAALPEGARPAEGLVRARILVIDDEPLLGNALKRLLGGDNDVTVVTSPERGLEQISAGPPFDLVLCDLMMPETTGMDLYRRLMGENEPLAHQLVFMTGGVFTPEAQRFTEAVSNTFLQKPVTSAQLAEVMASRAPAPRGAPEASGGTAGTGGPDTVAA